LVQCPYPARTRCRQPARLPRPTRAVLQMLSNFYTNPLAPGISIQYKSNSSISRCAFSRRRSTTIRATASVDTAPSLLKEAAQTRKVEAHKLYDALRLLEKKKEKQVSLQDLNGQWQLCFTTGTKKVQTGQGTGSYFPIKAVQSFNAAEMRIRNGVYLGPVASLWFDGPFQWRDKQRMLEFDFHKVSVKLGPLGPISFDIGNKEAWDNLKELEQAASGGQGNIEKSAESQKIGSNPFFTFVHVDENVCAARGRGGGLAFWSKIENQPSS